MVSDYGFDDNGNRTTHRIGPASPLRGQSWPCLGTLPAGGDVTISGSYDAQDRMSAYGTCTYEYTRNGELSRRVDSATSSTTEYEYDEFGNLRRVVLPDTRVITYHIDGLNRRVGKSINGVRQWGLLYANQLEPVAELDADGNIVASFIYADRPHVPSLMLKGGQTYRIVADHLGSVRLVVNIATGAIAQRMSYDEYGNLVEDTNPGFQPFGYAGGLYDRDTGLVRFGARDYDAVAGRWTAKDPIGFGGGLLNLYSYVGSDSINLLDPSGLDVHGIFNLATGGLTVTDWDSGITVSIYATSGGRPFGDPIPEGTYDILDHPNPDFLRLEPLDDVYGNDTHDPTGRDKFRLHKPGNTTGCIAAEDSDAWNYLRDLIRNTSTDNVTVDSKSWKPWASDTEVVRRFGTLRVINVAPLIPN